MIKNMWAKASKPTTIYDAGVWYLLPILGGMMLVGVAVDYFWNYLILFLGLRWIKFSASRRRRFVYCTIVTALGLFIDWLYYELTWGRLVVGSLRVVPIFNPAGQYPALEFATILIPMVLIAAVNFGISRLLLRMSIKQAAILGTAMGILTAPWLITIALLFVE
jgi:hypothetical protein